MNKDTTFMLSHFEAAAKHVVDSSVALFEKLIEDEALFVARDTGDTFAVFDKGNGQWVVVQMSPTYKVDSAHRDEPTGLANFQTYPQTCFADAVQCIAHIVITDCAHLDEEEPRFSFVTSSAMPGGIEVVEAHPRNGDSWSSDNALATFEVDRAHHTYKQTKGEPVTLTGDEVSALMLVASEAR